MIVVDTNLIAYLLIQSNDKWAVPPVEGAYQFYRPVRALEWFVDGSDFITFGWSYDD